MHYVGYATVSEQGFHFISAVCVSAYTVVSKGSADNQKITSSFDLSKELVIFWLSELRNP